LCGRDCKANYHAAGASPTTLLARLLEQSAAGHAKLYPRQVPGFRMGLLVGRMPAWKPNVGRHLLVGQQRTYCVQLRSSYSMNDLAILILRIAVGIIIFAHGLHKFQAWDDLNRIWREDYGLPPGSVGLAGVVQIVGGVAITLGVFSPYVAPFQIVVMLVATWVAIWKHREPFRSTPHGKGWDVNFLLIVALLALMLLGDGKWSLVSG